MTDFQKKSDTFVSLRTISFGFALIIFVVSLIFLKPYFSKKTVSKENDKNSPIKSIEDCKKISFQELSSKLINDSGNSFEVVDIREEKKFEEEHIIGSKNIPIEKNISDFSFFEEKKTYIIVTENSQTEKDICKIFPSEKKKKIYILASGFANWKKNLQPTISAGNPYSSTDQSKISYINSEELKKIIDEKKTSIYIMDVREKNLFLSGHLKGAENIDLKDLEKSRHSIPLGKRIIVYDDSGILAFQAGVRLFDMGFLNVFTFSEGLNVWKQKGFEIVK